MKMDAPGCAGEASMCCSDADEVFAPISVKHMAFLIRIIYSYEQKNIVSSIVLTKLDDCL